MGLVPVIGTIILLVLMALPGESHTNRFGLPTGHVILTKQMAHEIGLIDATPTTGLTAGLLCTIFCAVVPGVSITNNKCDVNDNSPYSFTIGRVSLVNLDVYLLSHIVLVLLF